MAEKKIQQHHQLAVQAPNSDLAFFFWLMFRQNRVVCPKVFRLKFIKAGVFARISIHFTFRA